MNKNKVNVPKVRFPGFTEPWEQCKLGELLIPSNKKNNTGKYTQDDVLAASLGTELTQKHIFFGLRSTEESIKNYRIVNKGDVIYTKSPIKGYPNGIIKTNKGIEGIVPSLYCVYNSVSDVNSSIIQSYFEDKSRLDAYLYPLVNVGARNNVNITDLGFLEGNICIPHDIDEQNRIVDFIEKVSNLITLYQRKLEHLQQQKKGFLQKMFPKNGESFPELRFPGFTDPWEQRKLGEISHSFEYGLNAAATEFDGENKYIRITDIDDETRRFLETDLTSPNVELSNADKYKLKRGDILFARTGASVGKSYIYKEYDGLVYYAGFLIRARIKPEYDADFVFQNTLTNKYNKYIRIISQRSGQPGVNAQEYAEFSLRVPKYDEQSKIGMFFKQFDNLITLHQRKLEHLQQQKKGLLQQMFV